MTLAVVPSAFACTALYVGSDLTEDGTTMFGRIEDLGTNDYNKLFNVSPRGGLSGGGGGGVLAMTERYEERSRFAESLRCYQHPHQERYCPGPVCAADVWHDDEC